jgi:hypothetical protein
MAQERLGDQVRVDHVGVVLDPLLELFDVHLAFRSVDPLEVLHRFRRAAW